MGEFAGPQRVWLAERDTPGLAMSRSIGDYKVHEAGVIAEPEVHEYLLQPGDLALVIGSDGVFEFLSNEIIGKIVLKHQDCEKAANEIVTVSNDLWMQRASRIDDITCVVLHFS